MDRYFFLGLTQVTIVVHFLFILFVVFGGFFSRRRLWLIVVHLSCVAWAVFAELSPGVICPLTSLENYFGFRAGLSTYEEDFITRYLVPIIYQESLTRDVQFVIVAIVITINLIAYKNMYRLKGRAERNGTK